MKTEKTFKEIFLFNSVAENYLEKKGSEEKNTLVKCIESILKQVRKITPDYFDKQDLIRASFCLKDEKTKRLLMENKDYTFSEDGLRGMKEKLKELNKEKETIHQRILPENNDFDLTDFEKEVFAGFVIDEYKNDFENQFKD